MLSDNLIEQTVTRFPRFAPGDIEIEPVEKGGSDRKFYRLRVTGDSLILAKYGHQREENRHYAAIAQFLASLGVRVPRIYFHDPAEGLIWMEDLGESDLWSYRAQPWPARSALYRSALDQVFVLHSRAMDALAKSPLTVQAEFNAELYRWEQNYFFENCLGRYFGVDADSIAARSDRPALDRIAETLAAQPRVLVHRDFQSQNIMIAPHRDGQACLIDFQGMRPGLPQYDLASLLYDPYVALTPAQREELLNYYIAKCIDAGIRVPENFHAIFDLCALQRLMQALGAYGFLGLVKERTHFLAHIPSALASLCEVVGRIDGLENLRGLIANAECDKRGD
jgi:N-acetylmuramate 1-kinase